MRLNEISQPEKPIVLVFGRLCSGKGTFCKPYIQQGYHHITTSDVAKKVSGMKTRGQLQHTKDFDQLIADELINRISHEQPIVVDGIRQSSIVDRLMDHFGPENIDMVWLDAPPEVRKNRFLTRGDKKDDQSFEDAEAGDENLGLGELERKYKKHSRVISTHGE